ncbi:hypothetical protein SLA2020_262510 [Shorea laevis]
MLDSCLEVSPPLDTYLLTIVYHVFGPSPRHQLIFKEELENDGVCFGCEEPVVGPGYKCSASECNFLFHKLCTQLPRQIKLPPYFPNETLMLVWPLELPDEYNYCNVCGKRCNRCFTYCHNEDDDLFLIDITCTTRWQISIAYDDCQRHAFLPFFGNIQFTCQACGEKGEDKASLCSICRLFIHIRCA